MPGASHAASSYAAAASASVHGGGSENGSGDGDGSGDGQIGHNSSSSGRRCHEVQATLKTRIVYTAP